VTIIEKMNSNENIEAYIFSNNDLMFEADETRMEENLDDEMG